MYWPGYYSKYPEVSLPPDKTASSIITYTKSVCAALGIPEGIIVITCPVVVSSRTLSMNGYEWGIPTTTSSEKSCATPERTIQEGRVGCS